jgi:predicted NodU family carbamoyl transferase
MAEDIHVLGINYRPAEGNDIGHHPAAVLLRNGVPLAMCEEERFLRIKEAPGLFPLNAIQFCLNRAGIKAQDLAGIGWNWDPFKSAERSKKRRGALLGTLATTAQIGFRHLLPRQLASFAPGGLLPERIVGHLRSQLDYWLGVDDATPVHCIDHHMAHAASAYYASGFPRATIVTWDCWGDQLSGLIARGEGSRIEVIEEIPFERFSIGQLNDFVYELLRTSEKGNLMGLAPYGTPRGLLDDLVDVDALTMRVDLLAQRRPFPQEVLRRTGPPRRAGEPLEQIHKDLAADLQQKIEAFGMKIVRRAVEATGIRDRVNRAVKYRDWWRPFAPSMLAEAADDYLEGAFPAPFMIVTFPVRPQRVQEIEGVTHCDGTTRPQMVTREANPRYYAMIEAFAGRTGVPMVLNTSFNLKGEPLVNTPRDALRTFFSSGLDLLIMNNVLVRKAGC